MMRFEGLDVWKLSARLSAQLYDHFSQHRDFGFRDQITRSGLSIPSNIAEGYERESSREAVKFLKYAKGSAGELRTQIYIGMKTGYINEEKGKKWLDDILRISGMLHSLISKLKGPIDLKEK